MGKATAPQLLIESLHEANFVCEMPKLKSTVLVMHGVCSSILEDLRAVFNWSFIRATRGTIIIINFCLKQTGSE